MAAETSLNLHHLETGSLANGPGRRMVIWLQGCTLNCPGCFNPATHPLTGGQFFSVPTLLEQVITAQSQIEGLTISGGEPLQQAHALSAFIQAVRRQTTCSIILLSGYTWQEIQQTPSYRSILDHLDVLIAGRYNEKQRLAAGLLGSSNKTLHFLTSRYSPADFIDLPQAEIILLQDGSIHLSGIDPIQWQ